MWQEAGTAQLLERCPTTIKNQFSFSSYSVRQ
jgi:hypothetical protein